MNAIEIKGLTKDYVGFSLENLNLTLPSGCIMGLVGENGAGKSTTIRMILGMTRPDSGEITICGQPRSEATNALISYLPERTYFGIMKYERQIMMGLLVTLLVLSYAFDFSPFGFLAEKLTDLISRPIAELFLRLFAKAI